MGYRMSRNKAWLALAAAGALFMSGCGGGESSAVDGDGSKVVALEKDKVTIILGTQGAVQLAPEYVAAAKGFWKDEGLEVNVTETESGATTAIAAVVSGSAFSACTGTASASAAIEEGAPIKMMTLALVGSTSVWVARSEFLQKKGYEESWPVEKKLAMFENSTLGMFAPGDSTQLTAMFLLKHHGLSSDGVKFQAVRNAAGAIAGMKRGAIDGMSTPREIAAQMEAQGGGVEIVDYATDVPFYGRYPGLTCSINAGSVKDAPETVKAFVRGLTKATEFVKSHPDETKQILLGLPGFTAESIDAALPALQRARPDSPLFGPEHYAAFQEFQTAVGRAVTKSYEDAVESGLVKTALGAG